MDIAKLDRNMAIKDSEKNLYWYDAKELTIEGKGWDENEEFFDRLPLKAKGVVRDPVWDLSKCSAGISIHFSSNTSSLAVQWDGFKSMNHMPATGVSGVDLYVKHENKWTWLSTGTPSEDINEVQLLSDLSVEQRDYILYLPLYNSIHNVKIGIPSDFNIEPTAMRDKKPILFYGTSITQGGCASRAGMCYSAILGRWFDRPTINLGFSGNGIMEPEIIDLLCELDPAIYILDALPNMQVERINDYFEPAIRKLHAAHPETPIVAIDSMLYCNAYLVKSRMNRYKSSNIAQFAIYESLLKEGINNIHYIKDDDLIGCDNEGTVDGTHFTDLGYMRFSESIFKNIKSLIS